MSTADQILTNEQRGEPEPTPSAGARMANAVKQAWEELHIGEGHAMAMGRLGGHELTQALAAFPDSNIRPMEEPGVFGNPTPQIVSEEMGHGPAQAPVQEPPGYAEMMNQYAARGSVHGNEQEQSMEM